MIRRGAIWRLWKHVSPRRRLQLVALVPLMLVGAMAELLALGAVVPFLALLADPERALSYSIGRWAFRFFNLGSPAEILLPAAISFGFLAVVAAFVRLLLLWATNRFSYSLGHDLAVEVYRRTLYQAYPFHVARNTSESIASFNRVQQVITGVLTPILQGIVGALLGVAILGSLFAIDAAVAGGAASVFGVSYAVIRIATRNRLRRNSLTVSRGQSERVQAVQEGLGGIRDIILDGSQRTHVGRFAVVNDRVVRAEITNLLIGGAPRYLIEAIGMCIVAGLAYQMSYRDGGVLSALPVLGALALGAQKLMPLLQQVYVAVAQISGNYHVTNDVVELLELPMPAEILVPADSTRLPFTEVLELRDVQFRYGMDGPEILQRVNLRVARGSSVGFVGKTGSGKSTLLDLIMGLLAPSSGEMFVDGIAVDDRNRRSWQARIAHVPQAIYLSDATIAENIAFGIEKHEIDTERVRWAAQQAQISDFIEAERLGYETVVGERGVRLSGGQRQRIGIARALYRQADILVLDEATSALDDATETCVMQAIQSLPMHVTVLTIAHRLSTLQKCDVVVRVESGLVTPVIVGPQGLSMSDTFTQ